MACLRAARLGSHISTQPDLALGALANLNTTVYSESVISSNLYAGFVRRFRLLRCDVSKRADVLSQALKNGDGTVRQALQSSVNSLSVLAGEMDFETACFAIHAYAARDAASHSKAGLRKIARDWEGLAHQSDEDLSGLPGIFPDGELQHLDNWTKIIQWFRDRSIEQEKDSGLWKEKSPDPTAADLARNPGPTLLDVRTLPLPVRPRAFHRGLFDGSPRPNGTTNAAKRKIEAKFDPTPGIPLKRRRRIEFLRERGRQNSAAWSRNLKWLLLGSGINLTVFPWTCHILAGNWQTKT